MRRQICPMLLMIAPALLATSVFAARSDDPALALWQKNRNMVTDMIARMKPLNRNHIEDVMQIRVEHKSLVLLTPLANMPTEQQQRARFAGIRGTALVVVTRKDQDEQWGPLRNLALVRWFVLPSRWAEPDSFRMTIIDFPSAKRIANLSINASTTPTNQLTIVKTVQITNGPSQQVMLVQQKGPQSNGAGMIQLSVTDFRGPGGAAQVLNYVSPDFFTFVRQHPRQTNDFLRPLLRELGQESVFAPEPMIAWQVFSELWHPDPAIINQVRELLPALNADSYQARDSALAKLHHLGKGGAAVLMRMDRSGFTPEQNARVDRFLMQFAQLPARQVARLRSDPGFLLDCLYADDPTLRQTALERLRVVVGRPELQFDVNADATARASAVAGLRQQVLAATPPPSR